MSSSVAYTRRPAAHDAARRPQIGATPMIEVRAVVLGRARRIRLKLESGNPWGSIKDRTALGLIDALERSGRLEPGQTIIESTSGNLGAALAALARARGYRFVAVVDPKTSGANLATMKRLGAVIEHVEEPDEHGGYLLSRLERVDELVAEDGYVWTNQYGNPANPGVHYRETGPELWRHTRGACDAVFVAVSTGGTLAGVSRYVRERSPETHMGAVDVVGSIVFSDVSGPRRLVGIGASRKSEFLQPTDYDSCSLVTEGEAIAHCRGLAAATGVAVGGSSGAVLAACTRYLAREPDCEVAVCLCPDGGEKYVDTIYDDAWVKELGLDGRADETVHFLDDVRRVPLPHA
jgi:N-(2-amino-2-carboxyethyl)-L-glutamate synthase